MRPNCCVTRSTIAWTPCRSVTSVRIATAPGNVVAVSLALASSRSVTTTVAPSAASFPAIALPMPWPAPVTIAILSLSLPMAGSSRVGTHRAIYPEVCLSRSRAVARPPPASAPWCCCAPAGCRDW